MMLQVTPRWIGSAFSEDEVTIYTRVSTGVKEPVHPRSSDNCNEVYTAAKSFMMTNKHLNLA